MFHRQPVCLFDSHRTRASSNKLHETSFVKTACTKLNLESWSLTTLDRFVLHFGEIARLHLNCAVLICKQVPNMVGSAVRNDYIQAWVHKQVAIDLLLQTFPAASSSIKEMNQCLTLHPTWANTEYNC